MLLRKLVPFIFILAAGLRAQTLNPTYRFMTNLGNIDVVLRPDIAPNTVANFLNYVNAGSYTNIIVHRLVNGFVAQGGEYQINNSMLTPIATNPAIQNEYTGVTNATGTMAMALVSGNANSATSQWFFNLANNGSSSTQNLDAQMFTVFGQTNAAGITVLNKINALTTSDFSTTTGYADLTNVPITGGNFVIVSSVVPVPAIAGLASAASFVSSSTNGVSPGEIIAIFGLGLGPSTGVLAAPNNGVFGTNLAGTQVTFNGIPAPVYFTSSGQVNVIVPYGLGNLPTASVIVTYNNVQPLSATNIPVKPANPGILTFNASGTGDALILNYGVNPFIVINSANPASVGDVLTLYGEGYGLPTSATSLPDGTVVSTTFPVPNDPTTLLLIDGQAVPTTYFGGAPGLVEGVLQVNFKVPQLAPGAHQIQLQVGSRTSPAGVTLRTK